MMSRLVLWVAMVLALAGAAPGVARADWDDRPDPSEFEESLNPNGYWVDEPTFGRVWRPYESWDWRPYTAGQWVWTSYGWTWDSGEPWGWTYHYGRWGFSNSYGWVWTPGYTWGPAWVDWYSGDGYVGWVPLGPPGVVIVPGYWNYVHDYAFCSPHVHDVVVVHDRVPGYIVHHREQGWGARRPPDMRDIEHVSHHQIVRENDRPRGSVAPWVEHRLERGERVREHIADRGGERVIEHAGRGADQRDPAKPPDDGWRRRGDMRDDHGPAVSDRRIDGDTRDHGAVMQHPGNDDRRTTDAYRGRGADDRDDDHRGYPRRVDDADMAPRNDAHGWNRPPATATDDRSAPRGHTMERPMTSPPSQPSSAYRNGGGGFERGNGGGMQHAAPPVDHGHGAAGGWSAPTMQHGGGGGGDHGAASGHGGDKGSGHAGTGTGTGTGGGGNGAWTH